MTSGTRTPETPDGLKQLLAAMAAGDAPADSVAQAAEAIMAGLLDATIDERIEGKTALEWAAGRGEEALVDALLARGALARGPVSGDSVARAAQRAGAIPLASRVFRAARGQVEAGGARLPAVETSSSSEAPAGLGLSALRSQQGGATDLHVLVVEDEVKSVAKALGRLSQAPRREADVVDRSVADGWRLLFAYRLQKSRWTVVPCVFEGGGVWRVDDVPELTAAGRGVRALARALAGELGQRVVHLRYDELTIYEGFGGIERQEFTPEDWWQPAESSLPSAEDAARLLPDRSPDGLREAAARHLEQLRRMDAFLAEWGVRVPAMSIGTDGHDVRLALYGVHRAEIERADVVVLQEIGDAPRVRRTEAPASAPARLDGPPMAGPPLVSAEPPPSVALSEGSAHDAPPMVVVPEPKAEPPPVPASLERPVPVAARPPAVDPPPAAAVDGPTSAGPSAPPAWVGPPPAGSADAGSTTDDA